MSQEPRGVVEMVRKALEKMGADGLVDDCGDCACPLNDLMACGDGFTDCVAARKVKCECDEGCDYHLAPFDWVEPIGETERDQ